MREEQWIPLGLVTVPRPCKRGVIGLVDAGQEFNRQEGSLQMFTDSKILWYKNFGFEKSDSIIFILLIGLILSLLIINDLSNIVSIIMIVIGLSSIFLIVIGKFINTPKSVCFNENGFQFQFYFNKIKQFNWDSVISIKKDFDLGKNAWYLIQIKEMDRSDENKTGCSQEEIRGYGLRPELGRVMLLIKSSKISVSDIPSYLSTITDMHI